MVRRFKNESKAISILSHPNIVKVYDVSVTDKLQYIVMEYVDGITLKEYLKQRGGALTWKETVHFATQILSALQHAHSRASFTATSSRRTSCCWQMAPSR